jgi:DNA-directed RNA polymerase specialized sigma24 family protein
MSRRVGRSEYRRVHRLPAVYTAAFAASGDQAVAEDVAERVMLAASGHDATTLAERAVLLAVRAAPHRAFTPMPAREREVVALARLTGATTERVAAVLEITPEQARARMRSGLRALVNGGGARRTPPPPPDCGSGASPGHAGRES